MRTASACLVALALVCVGATGAIAQESDEAVPATEPTALARGAGGFENTGLEFPDPVMNPETGILEMRDGWIEFMVRSDDPRLDGPYRVDPIHMDIDPNTGISRMWGTGHIVRDEGTFEGPVSGFAWPYSNDVDGYTASGWLTGTGAYEGLVYHYRGTFDGEEAFSESIVFEGEVPPVFG